MTSFDTEDMLREIQARGLRVDEGDLIGGPFIPDGRFRIYDPETMDIKGYGRTLAEAFQDVVPSFDIGGYRA